MSKTKMILGDCLEEIKKFPPNSITAIVTDPPYGLSKHTKESVIECLRCWLDGKPYIPTGLGFMGKSWDAWVPGPEIWKECLRVLKPGGHLLCFAGTRSMDLMNMGIRLAGFELRDNIGYAHDTGEFSGLAWVHGQGFPKSTDISKTFSKINKLDLEREYSGYGTNLKPAWEPIILARKPIEEATIAENVVKYGTGAINVDGCRISASNEIIEQSGEIEDLPRGSCADGYDRPNSTMFRTGKPRERSGPAMPLGRWPANVILSHSDGCKLVGTKKVKAPVINRWDDGSKPFGGGAGHKFTTVQTSEDGMEEFEVYECVEGCPFKLFPETKSGKMVAGQKRNASLNKNTNYCGGKTGLRKKEDACPKGTIGDSGSAARFFYCAKANKKERNAGCDNLYCLDGKLIDKEQWDRLNAENEARKDDKNYERHNLGRGNNHPTVKPLSLLRYLVKLIRPPKGGIVLDPFAGSGTTGIACVLEGCSFIGIEQDEYSWNIAKARIDYHKKQLEEKEEKK